MRPCGCTWMRHAGVMAIVPEHRWVLAGAEAADSLVVNPHKWLFTPFDLSALYCRRMDVLRRAFSLVPEYLRTTKTAPVKNLMDTGVQLGRRFRALNGWCFATLAPKASARGWRTLPACPPVRVVGWTPTPLLTRRRRAIQRGLPLRLHGMVRTKERWMPSISSCWIR